MKTLNLAPKLTIPLEAVTETFAILGRRGSGKTHTGNVVAEEMLSAGQQIVVIDPLDVWHGLRSSADGKREGFPVVVFGGLHADVPLDPSAGTEIADAIIETGVSAIVALRDISKSQAKSFVGAFCERLYERKGAAEFRRPLHLFIDEADAFIPQRVTPDVARAYGAIDTIVRRGRSSGFGTTLISQRAAVIAKDVLTQTEVMVCHQTTGPQDRKALEAWVEQNDDGNHRKAFLDSLAGLGKGEAWFWSPAWLQLFQRVQVRPRSTFDSSSTPKIGQVAVTPQRVARADLDALRARLAAVAEPAVKGSKGKAAESGQIEKLEAEVARLEAELAEARASYDDLMAITQRDAGFVLAVRDLVHGFEDKHLPLPRGPDVVRTTSAPPERRSSTAAETSMIPAVRKVPKTDEPRTASSAGLSKCARGLLTALAQLGTQTLEQAAIAAGYAQDSGGVRNSAGELRAAGYVEGGNTTGLTITRAGVTSLGNVRPLPTGHALLAFWQSKLAKAEREILGQVVKVYPRPLDLVTAAKRCGYEPNSGGVRNAAGRLRTLALVKGANAGMVANEKLIGGAQ